MTRLKHATARKSIGTCVPKKTIQKAKQAPLEEYISSESLIMAQDERWRRA